MNNINTCKVYIRQYKKLCKIYLKKNLNNIKINKISCTYKIYI